MTNHRKIYYQLLMHLTTVAQHIRAEIQENQEREQMSFESWERRCYLKGQLDLLDDIQKTALRIESQD